MQEITHDTDGPFNLNLEWQYKNLLTGNQDGGRKLFSNTGYSKSDSFALSLSFKKLLRGIEMTFTF
jgi:hypothetical protein